MNSDQMKKKAAEILLCKVDNLEEIRIPEHCAVYFRNKDRGGGAVIISKDSTMLFVDPFFVDYNEHLRRFIDGERSSFE